jgi:uncharacterized repeat protein (TIGR03803 family)
MANSILRRRACIAVLSCVGPLAASRAQTFTTLASFDGTNGGGPCASLVQGSDGKFYGTTPFGGAGYGTIFTVTPAGTLTTFYSFDGADGYNPDAALLLATDGNLYGTTSDGGNSYGNIVKITSGGDLTTLHNFDRTDGQGPYAGLLQASDGDFYGTTAYGGNGCPGFGCGTVFKITPDGTLTTLHRFSGADGEDSQSGLVQALDGNFYGTTDLGGANCIPNGCGTIFIITPGGTLTTLHSFDQSSFPGQLVPGSDGNLYGTTRTGGAHCDPDGCGTIFKMTPGGTLTTLHSFDQSDGALPSGLLQATDGNFYGTTALGGPDNDGTIFKMTPDGKLTTLHSFDSTGGQGPNARLLQATDGDFYGTTASGGFPAGAEGTVFRLSVGLGPFVKTVPHFAKVGDEVEILGTNLAGATSVTFNGVAAVITVVSPSEISTAVPAGATTGKIRVTTPGGALLTGGPFYVIP